MRLSIVRVLPLVAALSLAGCGTQAPTNEFGKEDVTQIRQLVTDLVAAYNAKDVAKIEKLFSANSAVMPPNRSTLRGIEPVKGYFEGRWKDEGATNLSVEPETIDGHGPMAFVAGAFSLELKGPDGAGTGRARGKVLWVVRKYAGQWKFEWQIMSSDLPPVVPEAQPTKK